MASFKIIFACIIFKIQTSICHSSFVDLTSSEVGEFIKTLDTRVIYFETKDSKTNFPLYTNEYAEAAKSLDSYGVQFGKVNCLTQKHEYCSEMGEPSVFIFRDGKLLASLSLDKIDNEDAIVANILHRYLLIEELVVLHTEQEFEEILNKAKGKTNIILVNVKTIGMKGHRCLLEVVFAYGDTFKFYLTTKLDTKMFGGKSKLKVFMCKEEDCEARLYKDDFKLLPLATFIQSLTVPQAIILGKDEVIPYSKDTSFSINKVYMFVKAVDDVGRYRKDLEEVAKNVKAAVCFIIVQVEKHKKFMRRFGLAEDSGFPALGFIPGHRSEGEEMEYVDVFTDNDQTFATDALADFIHDLVTRPAHIFGNSVDTRSLTVNYPVEYLTLVKDNELKYLMVAFCKQSVEECPAFTYDYQQLSRTFDRHFQRRSTGDRIIQFAIVFSDQDMDSKFNIESYPTMRLHREGQPVTEFTPFTGVFYYNEMVEFVKKNTGVANVLTLLPSGLDNIDLADIHTRRSSREVEETPTLSGDDDGDGDDDEDYENSEKPAEETEDDEVAVAGYEIYYTKAVNDAHVPKLNDTSFNTTIQRYDTSVVFFFLPWDARSQAFSLSYASAASRLGLRDSSGMAIGAMQVNCYDWEDVCQKENIELYPTIRIYRKKKAVIDYNGILDEPNLVKFLKLLQASLPVELTSDGEEVGFEEGKYPMPAVMYTDISLIGLFALKSSDQVPSFRSAAQKMEGQYLFGYATREVASDAASRLDVSVPSIVLIKRNDPLQKKVVFEGDYTEDAIVNFVKFSSLPLYGELTPLNFPLYFSKKQPFLIAFMKKDNVQMQSLISDVVKSAGIQGVSFCWLDISVKVNLDILKAYTEQNETKSDVSAAIVLVNHQKAKTYTYNGKRQKASLVSWIKRCLSEAEHFTGELKFSEWKPRLEGYDFLAKIKKEAMEDGEDSDGKDWDSGKVEPDDDGEDDDDKEEKGGHDSSTNIEKDRDNQRFHAAFHAKKQSRLNQRRVVEKPSHAVHGAHTEL